MFWIDRDGHFVQKGQPKGVRLRIVLTAQLKLQLPWDNLQCVFFLLLRVENSSVVSFSCRLKLKAINQTNVDG